MRDVVVFVGILALLPLATLRPMFSVYIWTWFALMAPHRGAHSWAQTLLPYNKLIFACALLALVIRPQKLRSPGGALMWGMVAFFGWVTLATLLAEDRGYSLGFYVSRIAPILVHLALVLVVINSANRLHALVWVFALALGWHAVKLGLVTLLEGGDIGQFVGFGPADTMIEDRNHFALALIMTAPLILYLYRWSAHWAVRAACLGVLAFDLVAILGTHSRGGFLTLCVMLAYLWWGSKGKVLTGSLLAAFAVVGLFLMPASFTERMTSILVQAEQPKPWEAKDFDESFKLRLMAWCMAYDMAEDSPVFGKGPRALQHPETAARYGDEDCPFYGTVHWQSRAAHSVYFEVASDAGFVGLALFVGLGALAFWTSWRIGRRVAGEADLAWAGDLAWMLRVSVLGYMVGGGLLSMAYYDGYYLILAMLAILDRITRDAVAERAPAPARRRAWSARGHRPQDRPALA